MKIEIKQLEHKYIAYIHGRFVSILSNTQYSQVSRPEFNKSFQFEENKCKTDKVILDTDFDINIEYTSKEENVEFNSFKYTKYISVKNITYFIRSNNIIASLIEGGTTNIYNYNYDPIPASVFAVPKEWNCNEEV